jgi:dTDP-4-amino-4,6-dideoxygalactose transaminase
MGVSQDETLNHRLELRRKIGEIYEQAVRRSKGGVSFVQENTPERVYSDFPVVVRLALKDVIKYFEKNEVEVARPFPYPLHHYTKMPKMYFPNTEHYYLNTLMVPMYSTLMKKDVDLVGKIIASLI